MNFIDSIVGFLTDTQRKLSHRLVFAIACMVTLFVIDDIFGFSYFYTTNHKIEQVAMIDKIIKDSLLDQTARQYLTKLKSQTIQREGIIRKSLAFISFPNILSTRVDTVYVTIHEDKKIYLTSKKSEEPEKNKYWHYISANIYWLLFILIIPFAVFSSYKQKSFGSTLLGSIVVIILILIVMQFWSWLFNLIPLINDKPLWNYLVNLLINTIVFGGSIYMYNKRQ